MPGIYITQPMREMNNIIKVGTVTDRDSADGRLQSLWDKHYYPLSIKDIRKQKVIPVKKGHPSYKILNKKCRDFEKMVKNFFVDKKVKVMNDAHLRIVNMNNETVGHYDRTILNNGGSDFLLLNEKELKKLDILFDHTAGELENYL
jgi:hypothetical protein